jgi:ParD-like antitoxin of type II bacterial toxin-antitoxin system
MSQPVKISDALLLDARIAAEAQKRSIAGQVEFWAGLGRSLEELLEGRALRALRESGKRKPLSELVSGVGTEEGRARLKAYLDSRPFPHFEPHPKRKGVLVRIEQDGTRSVGRFVNREFVVDHGAKEPLSRKKSSHA